MDTTGTSAPEPPKSLTRRQLYDLVWSMPMSKLARSFGWSDVWLAKLCREAGVPPPQRGYWAKKRAGKRANRRGLSTKLDPDEVIFTWDDAVPDFEAEVAKAPKVELDEDVAAKLRELDAAPKVEIAGADEKLHRLVAATNRAALCDPPSEPVSRHWRERNERERQPPFEFEVGRDQRARALRILDAVVRSFEAAGFEFAVPKGSVDGGARVSVLGEPYSLAIREPLRQRPYDSAIDGGDARWAPRIVWERSGRLVLQLVPRSHAERRSWSDTEKRTIESVVPKVVRAAVRQVHAARRAAIAAAERAEQLRKEEEAQRLAEENRRREKERQRLEQMRIDALIAVVQRWRASQDVRDFAAACAEAAGTPNSEMSDWLAWIHEVAARIDPLSSGLEHLRSEIEGAALRAPAASTRGMDEWWPEPQRRWHPNARWPPKAGR